MAIPESTIKKSGETSQNDTVNHQHTIDVNVLRRQRQQAFREVGFAAVAEQKAVNGYSAIITPSSAVYPANTTASDSCLSTPLIDISNLGGSSDNLEPMRQKQHPLHHGESNPMFLSPEAGLHRDGEQARLVELVRRRQLQQQQNYEENTLQWLEESAAQLWESILVFGGLMEDPHIRSPHSTMPVNPYRDNSRSPLNNTKSNHEQNGNILPSSDSKKNDHPTSQPIIIMDGPPSSPSSPLSRHRRIIRSVFHTPLRILYAFRWSIDFCITRLACLEPLLPNASSSTYSTSPVYSLRVTADDILRSLMILCLFFYCIFRMQVFAGPMVIMMCVFIGSVSRKVMGRAQSLGNQQQTQQVQQLNATQSSITGKETTISTIQPKYGTPNKSIATNDQLHARAIQRLQKQFPNSTHAECNRFFTCVKYKEEAASKRIDEFLKWRSGCGLKTIAEAGGHGSANDATLQIGRNDRRFDQTFAKKDEDDWNAAAKVAMSIVTKSHGTDSVVTLPQIICSYEEKLEEEGIDTDNAQNEKSSLPPPRCKDGTRILHIMVARVDLSLATAPTYSLAAALYLDRRLSRSTAERITLVSDVRGGRGWANPTPWSMLPFVQSTASLLGSHYPERLERLVLFPMPKSAIWVWSAAQKCLDPNTSSKVVVVSSGEGSGLPERMTEFVAEESLNVLEERRRSFFVGSS